ncbi:hypothetical protein OH492_05045 [Vibrio chagasii]|nr:hypothetical protein [Vibrio chagasii]
METLNGNWRGAAGAMEFDSVTPFGNSALVLRQPNMAMGYMETSL